MSNSVDLQGQRNREPAPQEDVKPGPELVMERLIPIRDMDRSFDIEYWQRQGDAAIYRAAWELVEFQHRDRGGLPDELRLQRAVESLQRG
jgi:hypothetical protein